LRLQRKDLCRNLSLTALRSDLPVPSDSDVFQVREAGIDVNSHFHPFFFLWLFAEPAWGNLLERVICANRVNGLLSTDCRQIPSHQNRSYAATGKVGPRSAVLSADAIPKGDCYATSKLLIFLLANIAMIGLIGLREKSKAEGVAYLRSSLPRYFAGR